MSETTVKTTLRDSAAMRWTALLLLALGMFCAYIFMDILSPIKDLMESTRGWDSKAFGWIKFNGAMVVPELRETDAKRGAAYLGGVQKGPRNLLLAKVCPLSGGDWCIGLGVLDCRGFKWP